MPVAKGNTAYWDIVDSDLQGVAYKEDPTLDLAKATKKKSCFNLGNKYTYMVESLLSLTWKRFMHYVISYVIRNFWLLLFFESSKL